MNLVNHEVFVGVDGGGSKTKVMVVDAKGKVISEALGGPSSYRSIGFSQAVETVTKTIQEALNQTTNPLAGIFAGLGDIVGQDDKNRFAASLKQALQVDCPITVENDVYAAFYGALDKNSGVIIILGTGSVAFGIDEDGNTHRSGGYTFKEGDPGSAYDLGKHALSCIGKALDGRITMTPLIRALMETLHVHNRETATVMYETMFDRRRETAQLAQLVTAFADQGDEHAKDICDQAARAAAEMVFAVDRNLRLDNYELGVIGSLGNANTYYKMQFENALRNHHKPWVVHAPKLDPALGAARRAKQVFM